MPTAPADLTETTVRYLFATTWLPSTDKDHTVAVPGGETTALDTAGSLLHIAHMEAEPKLSTAVASDCLRAVLDAYNPNLGD